MLSYSFLQDESADFFIEFIKLNGEKNGARYFLLQFFLSELRNMPPMISMNLSDISKMGPFLIIALKLYSYKDSDVRNLHNFKYFYEYFRH